MITYLVVGYLLCIQVKCRNIQSEQAERRTKNCNLNTNISPVVA